MVVLLYKSGVPVQLSEQFSGLNFDIEGFLTEFTFQETTAKLPTRYIFYSKSKFKTDDQKRTDLVDGFYDEMQYLKYIENIVPNIPLVKDMIYTYKFNFEKYLAKSGDAISVNVINFETPYNLFYDRINYDFVIENTIDNKGVRTYAEGILDGFEEIDYKLRLPSSFNSSRITVTNQLNSPGYYFYAKNLGDYIDNFTNNDDKRKLKKIMMLIIFRIRYIVRDVFPNLLNNSTSEAILETAANANDTDLTGLSNLEQMLFLLKKSWGYYYDPNSILPHRSTLPIMFNEQSTYADFEYYYIGLVSFYDRTYKIPHALSSFPEEIKYEYLLEILPINALSIIPIIIKKSIIESFIKKKYLAENEKRFLVRIIVSIPFSNADSFLDYLSDCNDGVNTNYQVIYYILGDARIERYYIASGIADEIPTRKQFVFTIFELWKASKYNFYYIPNGVTPISNNINPNSYFIQNFHEFQLNNALVFTTSYYFASEGIIKKGFEYAAQFVNKKIQITKFEKTNNYKNEYVDSGDGAPAVSNNNTIKLPEKVGDFHMYHPISLIGIQPDLEVILPEASCYPAFLFQYIREFEDIKEFDASVNLGIAITIELALAYFTGGLSGLKYLNYLKYTSRIYQALTNTALAGEQILIWTALEGVSNALAVSGSILYSYNQYLVQLSNDPDEIEKLEKLNAIIFWLILAQAAGSLAFRYKAVTAADEFLDSFPTVSVPTDVENLLVTLRGQKASNILSIRQKIADLELEGTNSIITKFDNYAVKVKEALWTDFKSLSKQEWNRLNSADALSIDRWKYLYDRAIIDRKYLNIIRSQIRVDAFVKYYNTPLRDVLEPLEATLRLKFLNTFEINPQYSLSPTGFNKMVNSPIRAQLALAHLQDIKQGSNILATSDIKYILESNAHDLTIDFKIIDIENSLNAQTNKTFNNIANRELLLNDRLLDIHRGNFDGIVISGRKSKNAYEGGSKLVVEIQVYDNGVATGNLINEKYIAGYKTPQRVFGKTNTIDLPYNFKDFDDYSEFDIFSLKAIDLESAERFKDAEKKFIYNFYKEHWNKGDKFVIELESTIDICSSCQGYLSYLKKLGAKHGKTIEYKVISKPGVTSTKYIK